MTAEHRRRIRIDALDLRLSGVDPAQARAVAAALPAAIAAAMGQPGAPAGGALAATGDDAPTLTRALAREIAARIRAGIDRHDAEEG